MLLLEKGLHPFKAADYTLNETVAVLLQCCYSVVSVLLQCCVSAISVLCQCYFSVVTVLQVLVKQFFVLTFKQYFTKCFQCKLNFHLYH